MISAVRQTKHTGGRPIKIKKRNIIKGIRLTLDEYLIIKTKSDKAGKNITTYIRQAALEQNIKPTLSGEERHYVRQLIGMANNLKQLTKKAHQQDLLDQMLELNYYKKAFDNLLEKLEK